MKRLLLLFVTAITIISCQIEEDTIALEVKNNTNELIFISLDFDNTVISSFGDPTEVLEYQIAPSSRNVLNLAENAFAEGRELTLIIVTETVINTNAWQDIVDNDLYTQRIDADINDLRDMNFLIEYN